MEAYFQNMVEELRQIRRDLHKIPELGLKAVSYTHLDVYKRQSGYSVQRRTPRNFCQSP